MAPLSLSRWLRPEEERCPVCGRTASRGRKPAPTPRCHPEAARVLRRLCAPCLGAVPWIASPSCRVCGRPEHCPDCPRRSGRQFSFCRCAVRYDDRMRQLLALYKYRGDERLEPLFAAMLSAAFERIAGEMPHGGGEPLFHAAVPVPLAEERLGERGFNQAERMARTLSGWYGLPCLPLLERVRHTEKQSLKDRRGRLADMKGNFAASGAALAAAAPLLRRAGETVRILLVDDIYTTGSTVNECAGALKAALPGLPEITPAGIEIFGALWARS